MKKIILLLSIALSANFNSEAQFAAAEYLDINKVRARYMVHGDMFWNPDSSKAAYEFPKGSGKHANFASSLWIGGYDQSTSDLKVAAQTYRTGGNDYWPGPLDENNGGISDSITSSKWAQIWKVNKTTIDSFVQLSTHTLTNTPKSIMEWPGRQNPNAKTPTNTQLVVPNREFAPFVDVNNDNVYNALDGDYPQILGDQMLFWVFNDNTMPKTQTGSDPLKIEIHASAYAYNCPALENVTYINYRIHNWSTSIIDSTYIGLWNDVDLGFALDDYIGYDSISQMGVCYNADSLDETPNGYGTNLTQSGVILVRGPRIEDPINIGQYIELGASSFTYFNNGNSGNGDPKNKGEFYNYMTGSWRDGSTFKAGCSPYNSSGASSKFVFPNDPSNTTGVSEKTCNNAPGDRRYVLSSGPFKLIPGVVPSDITFAFLNTDRSSDNSNFNALRIIADSARNYRCGNYPLSTKNIKSGNFKIYPNPTSDYFIIEDEDFADKKISVYNSYGQLVLKRESKDLKTNINMENLANGLYFIKIQKKGLFYSQSVLFK